MALVLADRVRETTLTIGTGSFTLSGAVSGFQTFSSVLSTNDTTYYAVIAGNGDWEVGIGTFTAPSTLARTTVLSSSNSNSLVSFVSGEKNIIITQPSERAVYLDGVGTTLLPNGLTLNTPTLASATINSSTINTPTINTPTVSGGTFTTPTITTPTVSGGTFTNPTITGATENNPTLVGATLTDSVTQGTVVTANSAFDALRVTQAGSGNALVVEDSTSPDGSPFVITANGSLVAGYTSTVNAGGANNPKLEVLGTTDSLSTIAAGRWSADTSPASLFAIKSRNAVIGSSTIVQANDQVGQVVFRADDGVTFITAASIVAEVDGTPGASDMPGRLLLQTTADGASTPTTAVTINNAQQVGVGAAPVASKGTFQVGTLGYTDTGILAGLASSVAGYNQVIVQNTSNNAAASSNINVSNDSATASTNFVELGINSSAFTGTGSFNQAGYTYLASASTDIAIGTYGSNNIRFVVNSGTTDAGSISSAGRWAINAAGTNTTSTALLHLGAGTATASTAPLKFTAGTNLTSPEAGTFEYDGNVFYGTSDVTSGRGYLPNVQFFRLTADGTAAGPAIANFFGATSGVSLDTSVFYELEANLFFTKTTAGTVTFTMTFTNAPINNNAWYSGSPVGGIGTVGAPQTAAIVKSTATAGALPVTGSLTTAVNHQYQLSSIFQANATTGGTLNIQITSSAGTVTPLTGSYFKITRLPSANSGAFA